MGRMSNLGLGVKRLLGNRSVVVGGAIFCGFVLVGVVAPYVVPFDPTNAMVGQRLEAPNAEHWFGTDHLGRDIFSRVTYGVRLSIFVGLTVVVSSLIGGIAIGLTGGYSKRYGNVVMRLVDGLMAFPGLILALALVAILGSCLKNIIIALSFAYVPRIARVVHAMVLKIKSMEYIDAATAIGAGTWRIVFSHLLPNTVAPVIVQASFLVASAILAEASLSFLGVGLPMGSSSLGVILAEGRSYLLNAPWITLFPGFTLFMLSIGSNILGDGLRDLFDPRYRGFA